jgi:DnaJ-class molecular chaperone
MFDAYQVLGVGRTATSAHIKKAYHKLALKYHPDKAKAAAPGGEDPAAVFKRINEAYSALKEPGSRRQYDMEHPQSRYQNRRSSW